MTSDEEGNFNELFVRDCADVDTLNAECISSKFGNGQYNLLEHKHRNIYPTLPWDTWTTDGYDYSEGVVLSPSSSGWDADEAGWPSIVIDGETGEWKMAYTGNPANTPARIGLATSNDGKNWTKSDANPILSEGSTGDWDESRAAEPSLVRRGSEWWVYYNGMDASGENRIGFAVGSDLTNLSKAGASPVLSLGASGAFDEADLFAPNVFRWGGKWHMVYVGVDANGVWRIGGAWSLNGIEWTKYSSNPILTPSGTSGDWRGTNLSQPTPLPHLSDGDALPIFVSGDDGGYKQGGLAFVDDFPSGTARWHPENPLLEANAVSWNERHNRAGVIIRNPGEDEWYIYITAQTSNIDQHTGLAKLPMDRWGAI